MHYISVLPLEINFLSWRKLCSYVLGRGEVFSPFLQELWQAFRMLSETQFFLLKVLVGKEQSEYPSLYLADFCGWKIKREKKRRGSLIGKKNAPFFFVYFLGHSASYFPKRARYSYRYSTVTSTFLQGNSYKSSGIALESTVMVEVLGNCQMVLKVGIVIIFWVIEMSWCGILFFFGIIATFQTFVFLVIKSQLSSGSHN